MPINAATAALVHKNDKSSDRLWRAVLWTGPVSYVTGGELATPAGQSTNVFGLKRIEVFNAEPMRSTTAIRTLGYDRTNNRIMWFGADGNEIGNGTNLSAFSGVIEVGGR